MQTFLPYESFFKSAEVLDNKRLGKQRVEVLQILKALYFPNYGWRNHPIVKMWKGYERLLCIYGIIICCEWKLRGFVDNVAPEILKLYGDNLRKEFSGFPPWLGNKQFHLSHQSNLLHKYPEHYSKHFKNVPNNLPYQWWNPESKTFYTKENKK